jgi:hypothetical protein
LAMDGARGGATRSRNRARHHQDKGSWTRALLLRAQSLPIGLPFALSSLSVLDTKHAGDLSHYWPDPPSMDCLKRGVLW